VRPPLVAPRGGLLVLVLGRRRRGEDERRDGAAPPLPGGRPGGERDGRPDGERGDLLAAHPAARGGGGEREVDPPGAELLAAAHGGHGPSSPIASASHRSHGPPAASSSARAAVAGRGYSRNSSVGSSTSTVGFRGDAAAASPAVDAQRPMGILSALELGLVLLFGMNGCDGGGVFIGGRGAGDCFACARGERDSLACRWGQLLPPSDLYHSTVYFLAIYIFFEVY
jgi:hypothetical protein